jgi:DNA polymerase I-like protein with 3'-5' exonuclease and polymerase domains
VDLYKVLPAGMRIQTQIHDDIRWETAESNVESMELVRATMEAAWPTLRVPLVADPKMGKTWRDLK